MDDLAYIQSLVASHNEPRGSSSEEENSEGESSSDSSDTDVGGNEFGCGKNGGAAAATEATPAALELGQVVCVPRKESKGDGGDGVVVATA